MRKTQKKLCQRLATGCAWLRLSVGFSGIQSAVVVRINPRRWFLCYEWVARSLNCHPTIMGFGGAKFYQRVSAVNQVSIALGKLINHDIIDH